MNHILTLLIASLLTACGNTYYTTAAPVDSVAVSTHKAAK